MDARVHPLDPGRYVTLSKAGDVHDGPRWPQGNGQPDDNKDGDFYVFREIVEETETGVGFGGDFVDFGGCRGYCLASCYADEGTYYCCCIWTSYFSRGAQGLARMASNEVSHCVVQIWGGEEVDGSGASYTTVGYDYQKDHPSAQNIIGNPAFPGKTSCGGGTNFVYF